PGQDLQAWAADETTFYQLGQVCTLKKFYVLLAGSPGAGNKYDFTIRLAGAGSNVVTTIAGDDTTGNSGALEDTVALDEYVSLEVVPDDTPTIRDAYWGLVCFIPVCPRDLCLFVNGYAVGDARDGWTKVGDSPYIDILDFPTDYIWSDTDVEQTGDYSFEDMTQGRPTTIEVSLYCKRAVGSETITVNIWDGFQWNDVGDVTPDATWAWKTIDVSATLNSFAKVNVAKMWLQHNA
ncbi:unnamed protein product, partial [marine sediment metagenome]